MDDCEKFNEALPEKEYFYSHLNIEDITNVHYMHIKRVCKDFEIKKFSWTMNCMLKVIHQKDQSKSISDK